MKFQFGIRTKLRTAYSHFMSKPNRDALFIFGFQKSGTSAIAGLLAEKTGKSVTIDTKYLWQPYFDKIMSNEIDMNSHVNRYSYPFSKFIIKEPNTTFFIKQLKEFFYLSKYIFIVRNPFDNIRSILNRLNLPGDLEDIDVDKVHEDWKSFFSKSKGKNYISVLANLWVKANNQSDITNSDSCVLVKYEDFNNDKEEFIEYISKKVGIEPKYSIGHIVDKQFQPKGERNIDLKIFYGEKNYKIIEDICCNLMKEFNYK